MFHVRWTDEALLALDKMPRNLSDLILRKVEEHLAKDPVGIGKPLVSKLKGLSTYRVGDYRVIYKIDREIIQILVTKVAHRSIAYED